MRIQGVRIEENQFYAPYEDDCWMLLAKEIMTSYADKYSYQIVTTAYSQEEYDKLDKRTYLPIRRSILRNIENGPLRSIVNMSAVYSGLERKRKAMLESMGIIWKDNNDAEYVRF